MCLFSGQMDSVAKNVGDYEASFVPSQADFERLDPRFCLPPSVWSQLSLYADWGFAVFKLSLNPPPTQLSALDLRIIAERKRDGKPPFPPRRRDIHPMAFRFPRRDPSRLFFPTVHVVSCFGVAMETPIPTCQIPSERDAQRP